MKKKIVSVEEVPCDHVIYVDTDSCFASATTLIKHNIPNVDLNNDEQMTEAILATTSDVQTFVNDFYDVMAKRFFNLSTHRFDAKQEVISKTSFWLAKKRYAQLIINNGGVVVNEVEVKGIDVVRTSFPAKFREFLGGFLDDILNKKSHELIDSSILEFKDKIPSFDVIDIAKNTSVKFKSKDGKRDYNPSTRHRFNTVKGTPAQVKAALYYNDLLRLWELDKLVQPIMHGQKIKWVYLNQNQFGMECIAMKADDTDPDRIMDYIDQYVDRKAMYEQELKSKLSDFYKVLKWEYPNENSMAMSSFFEF
jgi:hypothetical protein